MDTILGLLSSAIAAQKKILSTDQLEQYKLVSEANTQLAKLT